MSIGVSRNADRRLVSILDRCVRYTAESKMTTGFRKAASPYIHQPFRLLRQYPVQFMAGIVALLGSVLGVACPRQPCEASRGAAVEDFSFTDPLTEAGLALLLRGGRSDGERPRWRLRHRVPRRKEL
ncbi:MAG: hypothetical protein ACLSVD_10350 [Eggerthellaceae bacterium]